MLRKMIKSVCACLAVLAVSLTAARAQSTTPKSDATSGKALLPTPAAGVKSREAAAMTGGGIEGDQPVMMGMPPPPPKPPAAAHKQTVRHPNVQHTKKHYPKKARPATGSRTLPPRP